MSSQKPISTMNDYSLNEYQALSKSAAILNFANSGILKFYGNDSLDLLNRLSTNNLDDLQVNQGVKTVITSNKGKFLDILKVFRFEDSLVVFTSLNNEINVMKHIDFFTFSEDVVVEKVTEKKCLYKISGPRSNDLINKLFSKLFGAISPYNVIEASIENHKIKIIRTDFMRRLGYEIIGNIEAREVLDSKLSKIVENSAFEFANPGAIETFRILNGIPAFGKELTNKYNPLEANLINSISFNKGCYVGQEVIARLDTYNKVQNTLCSIEFQSSQNFEETPSNLYFEEKQFGVLTSISKAPKNESYVGIGYISKKSSNLFEMKNFQAELLPEHKILVSSISPIDPM
jgi:folate-binding protein YgfZ